MVKKLQKIAGKQSAVRSGSMVHLLDSEFASAVKDSAQQIWQAGLGAFAKAQGEGGKVFDALVKEGLSIQHKTQTAAEEKLTEATERMTRLSDGVQSKAGQQWDKLESIFEQRVAKALGKLGVPSRSDVGTLVARIDKLSAQVAALSKAPAGKKAAKKAVPVKRAAPAKSAAPSAKPRPRARAV